jgi:hypothetical protein
LSAIRSPYKAGHAISLLFGKEILKQNQFSEKPDFSHSLGLLPKNGLISPSSRAKPPMPS